MRGSFFQRRHFNHSLVLAKEVHLVRHRHRRRTVKLWSSFQAKSTVEHNWTGEEHHRGWDVGLMIQARRL